MVTLSYFRTLIRRAELLRLNGKRSFYAWSWCRSLEHEEGDLSPLVG